MFEVRAVHPLVEGWESVDATLARAAGRRHDAGGTDKGRRDLIWYVADFEAAVKLMRTLREVPGVTAIVQEPIRN